MRTVPCVTSLRSGHAWRCEATVHCAEGNRTPFIPAGVNVGVALLCVESTPTVVNEVFSVSVESIPVLWCCIAADHQDTIRPFQFFCRPLSEPLILPHRFIDAAVKNFIPSLAGLPIPPLIGYYCKIGCATFLMRESSCCQQPVNWTCTIKCRPKPHNIYLPSLFPSTFYLSRSLTHSVLHLAKTGKEQSHFPAVSAGPGTAIHNPDSHTAPCSLYTCTT